MIGKRKDGMPIEFTKMSSKGQLVIPQRIRSSLQLSTGTPFAVTTNNDTIVLKKVTLPKIKSWSTAVKPFREAARKSKFTRNDLNILIEEVRRSGK